jgi:hypothetical protein
MINYGCMGVCVKLNPWVGVCNSLDIPITVHSNVVGGILILKISLGFYSHLSISIMINFVVWVFTLT